MSYTLTFSQLLGEFVTDKELVGAQDPYVIFEAGGRKCQTKAIKSAGAGTCEWKETYTLHEFAPKTSGVLEVSVYNHNTLRPDGTLGTGTVDLNNLGENHLSGSGDRVTVPLTDKKGKNVGALKFIIHGGGFTGTGSGSGRSSNTGYGTGAGVAGAGAVGAGGVTGSGHHHHHGHGHTGSGSGTGGQVTGVGAGSNYGAAQSAADKAARENRDVTIQDQSGTAAGRPTNTGAGYNESSRGSGYTGTNTGTSTGATTGTGIRASEVRGLEGQAGEVIDRKYYTGFEDRPQEQALVEQFREHNPYAKQYETTVQHTGRERLVGSSIEALGTNERVVTSDHHVHAHPHDHIARALPKGAIADRPGGEGWVQGKAGPICDSNTFEVTGDRTVDKERVTNLREHREFEKEFEVKTAYTGERALERGAATEQLNRERVLLDEKNKVACVGHPTVDSETGGSGPTGSTIGRHTGSGTGGLTGTGSGSEYRSGSGTGDNTYGTTSGVGSGSTRDNTGTGYGSTTGAGTTGSGYGTGSGTGAGTTGSGYGSTTGAGTTGSGYGTGSGSGTGTGTGAGTTGSGYGTGSGTGYGSGTGTGTGTGTGQSATAGMSTTQKIASLVPGTEANKEKKAAQGSSTY